MDRQRIINLFAAISTITVFGFALGLMFPLLALIMEERGIDPDIIGGGRRLACDMLSCIKRHE